jgi:type IVB pilus formation R64 PilN family outer membrane protein
MSASIFTHMPKPRAALLCGAMAVSVFITGCVTQTAQRAEQGVERAVLETDEELTRLRAEVAEGQRKPLVRSEQSVYVAPGTRVIRPVLPSIFTREVFIAVPTPLPLSLAMDRIAQITTYRVSVADDVQERLRAQNQGASVAATGVSQVNTTGTPLVGAPGAGAPRAVPSIEELAGYPAREQEIKLDMNYSGPLHLLLDRVGTAIGGYWRFKAEEREIEFYRMESRTYKLTAMGEDTTQNSSISNQSGGGGGDGDQTSGSSSVQVNNAYNVMTAIRATLDSLISADGGKYSLSPETGLLMVRDTPTVHDAVARYVGTVNSEMSREVVAEVKVVSVSLRDNDARGINWDAVYASTRGAFGLTTPRTLQGTGTLTAEVLNTATGQLGRFAGSRAFIDALASQGRVSVMHSALARTLNHLPVPIQNANKISYVRSSDQVATPNVGVTSSLELGEITVGFTMVMTPHINDDNRSMTLNLGINLSQLDELITVQSGTALVQAPNRTTRDFIQRVSIVSGQMLVISGFERVINDNTSSSISTDAKRWELGGNTDTNRSREIIVILVTPLVVDSAT